MAKSHLEPWEFAPDVWKNQTAFFTYLRGSLRRIWSRYPAKHTWKKAQLVEPPKGYKGRAKKLGMCHYCGIVHPASHLEVDHKDMAGSCNSWDTAQIFLYKLLDCNDNWLLACKPCHKIKSLAERKGISFEEASLDKRVIEFCKKPVEEVLDFLAEHQYTGASVSNATKRRKLVHLIFKGELNVRTS